MNDEVAENIFFYQTVWLLSEKRERKKSLLSQLKFFQPVRTIASILRGRKIRDPDVQGSIVPGLLAGDILRNLHSPKDGCLNKSVKNYEIREELLKASRECVIFNLERFCGCANDLSSVSRPLIAFMTTTKKAQQLEYYQGRNMRWAGTSYIRFDYKKLKYVGLQEEFNPKNWDYQGGDIIFIPALEEWMIPTQISTQNGDIYPTAFAESMKVISTEIQVINDQISSKKLELQINRQISPDSTEISTLKAQIMDLEDQLKISRSKYRDKLQNVMRGYVFLKPYRYKQLMNNFKTSVERKVFQRVDLDEWSFCIVYQSTWCSKNFVRKLASGSSVVIEELLTNSNDDLKIGGDGKLVFDSTDNATLYDTAPLPIDFKRLLNLTEKLQDKDILSKDPLSPVTLDKNFTKEFKDRVFLQLLSQVIGEKLGFNVKKYFPGQIGDLGALKLAFSKTKDGGSWIKEIKKEGENYIEVVTGPYFEEGKIKERLAAINNDYSLEGVQRGSHYKFEQIVSLWDLGWESSTTSVSRYVKPEHRYTPPPEAKVFSVIHDLSLVEMVEKEGLNRSFKEVDTLAVNNGVISANGSDYLIYFKRSSPEAVSRADKLKYVIDNRRLLEPQNFVYLYTALTGKKRRGNPPSILPFSIKNISKRGCGISIGGLEGMNEELDNVTPNTSFQWLRENLADGCLKIVEMKEKNLLVEVLITDNDSKPKKFKFTKTGDKYILEISRKNVEGNKIEVMRLTTGENGDSKLDINFDRRGDVKWNKTRLSLVSGDSFFDTETTLLGLFLLVSKLLGVKEVTLENKKRDTCYMDIKYQYYLIKYLAFGDEEMFSDFNFRIQDLQDFKKIADEVREMELQKFFTENKIPFKIQRKFREIEIKEICRLFLEEKTCPSRDETLVVERISNWFDERVDLVITSNLESLDLEKLKEVVIRGWV